jgi:hypothetical protein
MSVNILYTRLFNLSVFHDYYEDGNAKDYTLKPTLETSALLRGGRMLFKTIPKGATVLYRTTDDEVTPFVDKGPDARLIFSLTFNNLSEVLNISDLDESVSRNFKSGNIIYLQNNPASPSNDPASPEDLSYELLDFLESRLFTYNFIVDPPLGGSGDVSFTVTDENGNPVSVGKEVNGDPFDTTLTVSINEDGSYSQQIDLRNLPKGKYTITLRDPSDDSLISDTTFYADEQLTGTKVLALIDIEFNDATDRMYADTWEYAVRFSRKSTVWKYYIVDKTQRVADLDNFNLAIVDQRDTADPPYASSYSFTRDGAEPHATIKINGFDTVIFKSSAASPIPFYEAPLPKMELRKVPNSPADSIQVVIQNLPNPRHNGVVKEDAGILESEIYVFI